MIKGFPDIPPIWMLGAWGAAAVLGWFVPEPGWSLMGLRWLGLFWIFLACGLATWSAVYFRIKRTSIEPHDTPDALIAEGPFKITRNPIYLSMLIATAGWVLWLGAAVGVVAIAGLAWVLHRRFVLPEEARLRAVFGERAEAYFATTGRWL